MTEFSQGLVSFVSAGAQTVNPDTWYGLIILALLFGEVMLTLIFDHYLQIGEEVME